MGILERTGVLDRYKVSPTQGTSGLLTGQPALSPFAQQASRQIGGALGSDMRTPQEKVQQELKLVKDPLSPEGLLQRAQIISANSTDPKSLQVAAALAAESKRLQTAQTNKERAAQARTSSAEWLAENAPELSDLHDNFALTNEAVAKMAESKVVREAAEKLETAGKKPARRGKISVVRTFKLPKEEEEKLIRQIDNGDFDDISVQDLEDNFDVPLAEATIKNYIVYNDINDPSKGTKRIALRTDKYGRVHNGTDFVSLRQAGVREEAGVGKEATEPTPAKTGEALKGSLLEVAQNAYTAMSDTLSGSTLERLATGVAAEAGLPTEDANKLQQQKRVLITTFGRGLSGAAIPKDERPEWIKLTTPTLRELITPEALVIKMASNQYILDKALQKVEGTQDLTPEAIAFTSQGADAAVSKATDVMSRPFSEEELKAIREGRINDAVSLRLYGKPAGGAKDRSEESREERLARIKAQY
tara:strand:- start:3985 stop:5409 length:1425 start_codon:yes stop_codon:yes gene_type:complete